MSVLRCSQEQARIATIIGQMLRYEGAPAQVIVPDNGEVMASLRRQRCHPLQRFQTAKLQLAVAATCKPAISAELHLAKGSTSMSVHS